MQTRHDDFVGQATRLCLIGAFFLAIVFLAPDAGQAEHQSFFAVAHHCTWSRFWEWAAAWCSMKIIFLSMGVMVILDALAHLFIRSQNQIAELMTLTLAIFPALLLLFGLYDLVKAVL